MRELDVIELIASGKQKSSPLLVKGIGDDCAVFTSTPDAQWLASADMLIEGVHFRQKWHPPKLLGRKSVAVNISDIAAMGGIPQFILLCLALPRQLDKRWIAEFMDGLHSMAGEHDVSLIGGDTVRGRQLAISVTVLGLAAGGAAITREGACPGDDIYVSGPLGLSGAGCWLLEKTNDCDLVTSQYPVLMQHHLDPSPRVALGKILAESEAVTAMQDISDGIATDLSHICRASQVQGVVHQDLLHVHAELAQMCHEHRLAPIDFQLRGGEDYELLFTVQRGLGEKLRQDILARTGHEIFRIGEVREGRGSWLQSGKNDLVEISYQGYQHGRE